MFIFRYYAVVVEKDQKFSGEASRKNNTLLLGITIN